VPYREQSVASRVTRWIECVWLLTTHDAVSEYPVRPDGCIDIVYSEANGLNVVGAMISEQRFDLPARVRTAGIRFRPGMARSFFRVHAHELTNRAIPLEAFWGNSARELESRLAESRSADDCCRILAAAIQPPEAAPNGVQRAIEALVAAHGDIELERLIRETGISDRQFRRRCLEETGLPPKQLSRVLRFRHALALGARGLPWSLIAVEAGYFDQAHLIRDFREFTGRTPLSVFSNTTRGRSG